MERNIKQGVTGISRDEMTASGVTRPVVSIESMRLDARRSNQCQIAQHASDTGRWLVITPSGSVMGTSLTPMGVVEASEVATVVVDQGRADGFSVRMEEVAK